MQLLKPCPFCGNTSEERTSEGQIRMNPVRLVQYNPSTWGLQNKPDEKYFRVICGNCHARGGVSRAGYNALINVTVTEDQAKECAIKKWNQRKEV